MSQTAAVCLSDVVEPDPASISTSVGDVMTPAPTCVRPVDSVLQLVRTFHDKQFRHLLVTDDDGRLVGVVSDRDVVRCFGPTAYPDEAQLAALRADAVMSRDVVTIEFDATIVAALDQMQAHGFSSLPVLRDGRLVGIVTTSDLMRLLRRLLTA